MQNPGRKSGWKFLLDTLTESRARPTFSQGKIMKKSALIKLGIVYSACSLLAAGCALEARGPGGEVAVASEPGVVYADSAPPPLVDEPVAVAPGPDYVWIGGSWVWGGSRWNWDRGRWAAPPHGRAHWVPNHYAYRNGRHTFTKGHWR
jgi:hypothetical protein